MGYSGRYHAASLAAVFLALAIGILIGVGLGHNVIPAAQRDLEQSLKSDLSDARGRADTLQGQLNQERDFSQQAFPALVSGTLRGDRIAVVALGGLPESMKGDIESLVGPDNPTGAELGEVAIVREPPDRRALASAAAQGAPARTLARNADALSGVAQRMGRALVTGRTPFYRFRGAMLSRISGRPGGIAGVIVVRSRPPNLNPSRSAATDSLEAGLLDGLERAGRTPVVGVERSDTTNSSIGFFDSQGVPSTVDSIDLVSGRVALAYALDGAEGNFGIKSTADRLLPELRHPAAPAAASPPR
jgi:Copper transport outer membrane protein, MctB